ncbi:tRNA 5-methylaminomethyl-2-thiouridine synthase TusD [Pseudomonas amygdali pv. ciccaronei]|nr:tRNA 5-methylaminomethyl-2-thiouridine synthase TusD [Pseudomonas amygdali pv. ciccaronei]
MNINRHSDGCALTQRLQVEPRQTHTSALEFFIIADVLLAEPIMKFAISLFSAAHAPSSRRALLFAKAVLAGGHEIVRLFFYQDGVLSASANVVTPQDEQDMALQWRDFIAEHHLDGVVCIAAALRRGVLDAQEAERYQRPAANLREPWELSGLGQLHDAVQSADRLICFGGP